jgi:hypothetical protein
MFAIRLIPPFGKEHFGGTTGFVDWGRVGECLNIFEDNSNAARYVKSRPDLYRTVVIPSYLVVYNVVPQPPILPPPEPPIVPPPLVTTDGGQTWHELQHEAKVLGVNKRGMSKLEVSEAVAKAKNKGQ